DLWKLAQDGGLTLRDGNPTNADLNEVSKALTAFAMQKYYEETADSTGAGEKLFDDTGLTGGIRFDLAAVSSKIDTALKAGDRIKLADAKGFDLYFKNYLAQDGLFTPAESGLIQAMLPNLRDWYIQAGAGGMTATDTENRGAFMLGGSAADTLTGGDAADLLVGNGGDDILSGGKGSDVLIGGAGADTYKYADGDGLDTLFDDDGQGSIEIDGQTVTGGTQFGDDRVYRDSDGRLYAKLDDKRLAIAGNLFVENWQPGQLGIALSGPDAESAMPQTSRDINGDLAPQDFDAATAGVQGDVDELGNLKTEGAAPGRADLLFDSTGNDYIRGGGGDDIITAWRGGDDRIDGGAGNDAMRGDGGDDVLLGGDGSDVLSGGAGDDRLYADSQITVAQAIANGNSQNGTGQKADWLAGGNDDDILVGNAGNNVLSGGGGQDLLIGGAGDDYLLGDSDYLPAPADAIVFEEIGWSVNPYNWDWTVTPGANDTYTFQTAADSTDNPADSQADVIYAGSGNDVAWGGGGNDIIFGEAGNDKLIGNEGNDILLGGDITPLMKVGAGGTANDLWRRVAA
ncbi:MAG: hypothetical protein KKF40_01655, partial [Gammaproteobacteria bacterium]|nr:hypothetical protein [Gammaproteobacteria bacterium]